MTEGGGGAASSTRIALIKAGLFDPVITKTISPEPSAVAETTVVSVRFMGVTPAPAKATGAAPFTATVALYPAVAPL